MSREWIKMMVVALCAGLALSFVVANSQTMDEKQDYPFQPVPFTDVKAEDEFWAPRIETNRSVTIPYAFGKCEETGRFGNFERAARVLQNDPNLQDRKVRGYSFDDTDIYKVLEGASFGLSVKANPAMDKYLDEVIAKIAAAQEPDGYLYTARTINPQKPHNWAGPHRWVNVKRLSHELYNMGHLYEAAVAHYQATGKRTLLDIAVKNADLLCEVFGPGKNEDAPGHQIIEMGLVKLYRATGQKKYLELAKFFLDTRGPGDGEYSQAHKKVVEQTEAVGHAVRATYMYSGMADVAALTGDHRYLEAIDRIWQDVVTKKLYLTGGIGATGGHEGFGPAYELPNLAAYCETCAAIGNAYWNHRLFLLHGHAKYIDVMERTLYNGLISGVSLDGKLFFYPNPLESDGSHSRSPWFGCACCPGNITRFVASVPGYVYAKQDNALYVNLFVAGQADMTVGEQKVHLRQQTRYPWDGQVKITVDPEQAGEFTVNVRIPGWSRNEPIPSDGFDKLTTSLYRFVDTSDDKPSLKVNGRTVPLNLKDGYVAIDRKWSKGDTIDLYLPMPVRRVLSHEKVEDNVGKVALQRGPIVYCIEWPDVKDGHVVNLLLPDEAVISTEFKPELLGGVQVLRGETISLARVEGHQELKRENVGFTAIPYYAWAHRGRGEMTVWIAHTESAARPLPAPTIASAGKASASGGDAKALNDQREPKSSGDHSNRFLHWWPRKGTKEWVQYDFVKPAKVSAVEVYWFDDTGRGECRLPKSWQLFYHEGSDWKPVQNPSGYGCEGDRYNRTSFEPVDTDGLRLEVQLQEKFSAGIHEWRVESAESQP